MSNTTDPSEKGGGPNIVVPLAPDSGGDVADAAVVPSSGTAALQLPEFRYLLASGAFSSLAGRALAVVIGYQIYELTKNPLSLGYLGLVEAIPAVGLALFGGHVADRSNRRTIVLITQAISILCAVTFALLSTNLHTFGLFALYAVVFVAGIARGFADPAASAFEAQVVPRAYFINASAWSSSVWQTCAIAGPAVGGIVYAKVGATNTYAGIATLLTLSWVSVFQIAPKPKPTPKQHESIFHSIAEGIHYVFRHQPLVGSMALDLFAVLFGGAVALLPIFASDILKVGPTGYGFLQAAPSVGALAMTLWATKRPPMRNSGKLLLACVAGFGVSIIVFALSRNFYLSLLALALAGMFDGVSVIIRKTILRLMSPDDMRGRIAAVSWVFIGSSNEIGAFESGIAAHLLGTVRSVWLGGLVTLGVVASVAAGMPRLRNLHLADARPEEPEQANKVVPDR